MIEKNRHLDLFSNIKWGDKLSGLGNGLWPFTKSFYYGYRYNDPPYSLLLLISSSIGICILFHLDRALMILSHLGFFYPKNVWLYAGYRLLLLSSPFLSWGIFQTVISSSRRKDLATRLYDANLVNRRNQLPAYISDLPIDSSTRILKLTKASLPLKTFTENKDRLESTLQVTIDQIIDNKERGTVDILYGFGEMPKIFPLMERVNAVGRDSFIIGKTRAQEIVCSLKENPHWLVAGQSLFGKSTFVNQCVATLYLNNPDYEFLCIDLKGGIEFEVFKNTKRITVAGNIEEAIGELEQIPLMFEERMELLRENGCKDIEAYEDLIKNKKADGKNLKKLGRFVIAVDEVAELFLTSEKATGQDIQKTRDILSQVTRQGRALGVHAILATQRPDARALDTQVKANLSGIICYQLPNDASSILVLGNGRATDITNIRGRAILKRGPDLVEVQTPILNRDEINTLLADYRIDANSKGSEKDGPVLPTINNPTSKGGKGTKK